MPSIRNIISGAQTDGSLAVFCQETEPNYGPPLHCHHHQAEVFHILRGRHRFRIDGRAVIAVPGDCLWVPKGAPHGFRNIDSIAGLLHFALLPALNAEEFFQRLVVEERPGWDRAALFREYGNEIVGPPID